MEVAKNIRSAVVSNYIENNINWGKLCWEKYKMTDLSKDFMNVIDLIQNARKNALRKVNDELILLHVT
ncbi:MAG: hypothetical protein PWQ67_334 [Clostridia bacterium]|nr:hypothetical protein [Clostridia bacterium]